MLRPRPRATRFPYTTLFRSRILDDLGGPVVADVRVQRGGDRRGGFRVAAQVLLVRLQPVDGLLRQQRGRRRQDLDRKSTRLNSSHATISYAVFCLKTELH